MVLQFTMANASEAIWNIAGNPVSYTFNDIYLEFDVVVPHPMYASLLDRITQLEGESGIAIPVMSRLVSQGQYIPASLNSISESAIVVSRATTNLRRIMFGVQVQGGINNYEYPSVSCFPDAGINSWQCRVGSLYFPSQPANSKSRLFYQTSAAFGSPASTDKAAVYNRHNYDTTTSFGTGAAPFNAGTAGDPFKQVPTTGGQFMGTLTAAGTFASPTKRYPYSDFSVVGYCFDAYKNTEPLANDGISVLGQAGSQVVVNVRLANPEAVTPTVVLDATKVISLQNGGLRVLGA